MIKFFTKRMNNRKGFTLIELIVVIAILGILAAIAIPRLSGLQNNAKIDGDRATAKVIISAAQIFAADNNASAAADFTVSPATTVIGTLVAKGYLDTPAKTQTTDKEFVLDVTGTSSDGFTYKVTDGTDEIATQTPGAGFAATKTATKPFTKSNE